MKGLIAKVKGKIAVVGASSALAVAGSMNTIAKANEATGSGININFEPSQMFEYSNVIINCLMPVVYITAGLALGFTVIYALKSAFGSRM